MASTQATAATPTSVYRYYDRTGLLIYVGITRQGMGRNLQHNGKAEWWPYVSHQEVDHFPSRPEAAAREKELIRRFRPPFNKQHNLGHEELREAYFSYAEDAPEEIDSLTLYKRLGKQLPLDVVSREGSELVLRTRRQHVALAEMLRIVADYVPLCPGKKLGRVAEVRKTGSLTYLMCKINKEVPDAISSATADLSYQMGFKPPFVRVDKVTLVHSAGS